jgi:ribonuclease P protein component
VLQALTRPTGENGTPDTGPPRVGFTASRKVGNAVVRNRARRRLKAAADAVLAARARPGTDYVLIARAATPSRPYADLLSDLETALERVERPRSGDASRGDRSGSSRGGRGRGAGRNGAATKKETAQP